MSYVCVIVLYLLIIKVILMFIVCYIYYTAIFFQLQYDTIISTLIF